MRPLPKGILTITALMAGMAMASAQSVTYTLNIVGYINLKIKPGANLIVNQLDDPNDTVDGVLTQGVLVGSTFAKWDPIAQQLLPQSVWDGTSWSINYDFPPDGSGGVLTSPSSTTVTLGGSVNYFDAATSSLDYVPPFRPQGRYLIGNAVPIASSFADVVGRAAANGESVTTLDAATQTYLTTGFANGTWDNGVPSLAVGQAAYFTLVIPEPSSVALGLVSLGLAITFRRVHVVNSRRP